MGTYNGGEGNDSITGSNSNDTIDGRGGNDRIVSKDGADEIYSGSGNDFIDSGSGDDLIFLKERSGNSLSKGNYQVNLGLGDDWLYAVLGIDSSSVIDGGTGFDTVAFGAMSGYTENKEYYRTEHQLSTVFGFERWIFNNNNNGIKGTEKFNALQYFGGANKKITMTDLNFTNVEGAIEVYFGNYNSLDLFDASSVTSAGINFHVESGDGWTTTKGTTRNDKYFGQGSADKFEGNQGNDFFDGGDGVDTAIYSGNYSNYTISEITYNTFSVKDNVGTDGTDTIIDVNKLQFLDQTVDVEIKGMKIIGDDSAEEISGGDEADRIDGAGGNDLLNGGLGNDLVEGGTGSDELIGEQGNDFLHGGTGVDELIGGAGNDELDGGANDDLANYLGVASNMTINLATGVATGEGTDTLISIEDVIGGSKNDNIIGNDASNEITAGSGDDVVDAGGGDDLIVGGDGAGNDKYIGGAGTDTIKYTSAKAGITVNLAAASNQAKSTSGDNAGIGVDQLSGIENIIAGNFDDLLTGNSAANRIEAGSGNDTLDGSSGTDVLIGGAGNDTYIIDLYKSGTTLNLQDTITEATSAGADTLKLRLSSDQKLAAQTFTLAANLENLDASLTSTNKINLTGNSAANTLMGNAADNVIDGGSGGAVDKIDGGTGTDTISFASLTSSGTTGVTLNLASIQTSGSAKGYALASGLGGADWVKGIENITGSKYADVLTGNDGSNVINGGAGADTLTGGKGLDKLYGGSGDGVKDIFDFNAAIESTTTSMDLIYDFVSGKDKIDLSGMTPSQSNKGAFLNDTTKALGTAYKANSVWITKYDASGTVNDYVILSADLDGKSGADFAVKLVGINSIVTADIVL